MLKALKARTSDRSVKAYINIASLFTLKGVNMLISFLLVPLALNYLDSNRYGIWLTLSSIFGWFSLFDIGLGNGLRNRLAAALTKDDFLTGRIYVSTTYAAIAAIFMGLFLVFLPVNYFLDWSDIINTDKSMYLELRQLAAVVFFFFCLRFISSLITTVAQARQEPAFSQLIEVSGRLCSLLVVFLLPYFTSGSLLALGLALAGPPVIVSLLASKIIYSTRYKAIRPSWSLIKFSYMRNIVGLGFKFFILQISTMVFYHTNNFIITHLFGPEEVTPYSIASQYFNIGTFVFMIILSPYWSAFTDAYGRRDMAWIRKVVRQLRLIWLGLLLLLLVLVWVADQVFLIWVGKEVSIAFSLILTIAVFVAVYTYNAIFSNFLNGVGKLMLQLYMHLAFTIIYIPLGIWCGKQFGLHGIMFPIIAYGALSAIVMQVQYHKIMNGTARGLWDR